MDLKNINRVFIIGAGVSAHCNYPLTDGLLEHIILEANDKDKFHIRSFLMHFYPNFNQYYSNYPNIEDFMSQIDTAIEMANDVPASKYQYHVQDASEIEKIVLTNIYRYFYSKLENLDENMAIYNFVDCLKPNDVIISFNWDLNIEKILVEKKKKYVYYLDKNRNNDITILKPHGSMNWFKRDEVNFKKQKKMPLMRDIPNGIIDIFTQFRQPNIKNKEITPYIVPPIMMKTRDSPELKKVWENAHYAISHSKEINVLGYSLPNYDLSSRYIIRDAIRKNKHFQNVNRKNRQFLIANPDESVYTIYRNLVGDPIQFEQGKFENLNFEELFM